MENQFRVMLLVTTVGVMIGEGCSDPSHKHFNFTDPGYCSDKISDGKCWGTHSHHNITIDCADNYTDPLSLSWCGRDMTGYPECVAWKERHRVKCLSEIYETCYCKNDARGRSMCTCDRYMFWRVYPFIYIILGLVMVVVYVVCHFMKMCKTGSDDEDEDLTKIPHYKKQEDI